MSGVKVLHEQLHDAAAPSRRVHEPQPQGLGLVKGHVLGIEPDETVAVAYGEAMTFTVHCDLLHTAAGEQCDLARGDAVVAWLPDGQQGRGVVLGRLGGTY